MTATRGLSITEADIRARLAAAQRVFDQVDLFVAPSRSIADEFIALGLDRSKVRVSDYGFRPLPRPTRAEAHMPLRIGFVGTLVWHKGAHVLIDAVRQLPADAYELHVHGNVSTFPEYAADLRRQAAGLPVRFMGSFDATRTPAAYADMDVLVVPSLWLENSPLVIHEAFQCGVPVVGSDIGGISELVAHGRGGWLFEPGSTSSLAAVLRSLIDNPARVSACGAQLPDVKSIAVDARDWERTYAGLTTPARVPVATAG
jgi:glycosyltransferase involved in cell wall biosynthesis